MSPMQQWTRYNSICWGTTAGTVRISDGGWRISRRILGLLIRLISVGACGAKIV
jgi:hypothetical protein